MNSNSFFDLPALTFRYPWLAVFSGIALLCMLMYRTIWRQRPQYFLVHRELIQSIPKTLRERLALPILTLLFLCGLLSLAIAATRPQHILSEQTTSKSRAIMLVIDASKSMAAQDFGTGFDRLSRLDGVKQVVTQFIKARDQDRIGVVVFGSSAFLQAPLTADHNILEQLISRLTPGVAGDGTAIGDGLAMAVKRLQSVPAESAAIVLLTDGVSNSGQFEPAVAASVAQEKGLVVHTIGLGHTGGSSLRLPNGMFLPSLPAPGTEFDSATLQKIANMTGGSYFHAENVEGLREVYERINEREEQNAKVPPLQHAEEYAQYFALLGAALLLSYVVLRESIFVLHG